jgi:hypothetical protein
MLAWVMMISPGAALERTAKIREINKISEKVTTILPVGIMVVTSKVLKEAPKLTRL